MQAETLDGNFKSEHFAQSSGDHRSLCFPGCLQFKRGDISDMEVGCYSNNLLYSRVMRPARSRHVVVIQSEKTPAKMQLLKILVGGFFPVLKSQNNKDFF